MPQIAIYLDEKTATELDRAAATAGLSKSAWVCQAVRERLHTRLPESWFALFGTWEDDRTHDEIMRDIRTGPEQRERPPLS